MPGVTNAELFNSGLSFLNTYAKSFEERHQKIADLKVKQEKLQPMVEESKKIEDEIKVLQNQNKSDEKFLVSMNDMILKETGEPISQGPIFDKEDINAGEPHVN